MRHLSKDEFNTAAKQLVESVAELLIGKPSGLGIYVMLNTLACFITDDENPEIAKKTCLEILDMMIQKLNEEKGNAM